MWKQTKQLFITIILLLTISSIWWIIYHVNAQTIISTNISNAVQVMKRILVTSDWSSSGTIIADINTWWNIFFSGNVGIGTDTPTTALDVSWAIKANDSIRLPDDTTAWYFFGDTSIWLQATTDNLQVIWLSRWIQLRSEKRAELINGTPLRIRNTTNDSFFRFENTWTTGSSNLLVQKDTDDVMSINNSGYIGIGTISPETKVNITETTTQPILRLSRNQNIGWTWWAGESLWDIEFYTNDGSAPGVYGKISVVWWPESWTPNAGYPDGHIIFQTRWQQWWALSEKMRITDEGKVGIGTDTPTARLDVNGTGIIRGNLYAQWSSNVIGDSVSSNNEYVNNLWWKLIVSPQAGDKISFISSGDTTIDEWPVFILDAREMILWSRDNGAVDVWLWWYHTNNTPSADVLYFKTNNTEQMRIDGDGNVGIGISSPQDPLHVSGSIQAQRGDIKIFNAGQFLGQTNTANAPTYSFLSNTNMGMFRADNNILWFSTVGNERMRIDANGNIWIWTDATSAYKLIVNGTIATDFGSAGTLTLFDGDATRRNRIILGADSDGAYIKSTWNTAGTDAISFRNSADEAEMTIADNGNIGIGTTWPTAALDLRASTTDTPSLRIRPGTTPSSPNDGDIWYDGAALQGYINGVNIAFNSPWSVSASDISYTGNVWIGIESPSEILNVSGNIAIERNGEFFMNAWSRRPFRLFTENGDKGALTLERDGVTQVQLSSDPSSIGDTFIGLNTNVGIGTDSPSSKLDINWGSGYNQIRLRTSYTPSWTGDINGNTGDIARDDNYFYVKTSAWRKRSALSSR